MDHKLDWADELPDELRESFYDSPSPTPSPSRPELTPPQQERAAAFRALKQASLTYTPEQCTRCVVREISMDADSCVKTLVAEIGEKQDQAEIFLHDSWAATEICKGDVVNVIGKFTTPPLAIHITPTSGLLVHHPEVLLHVSSIAKFGSGYCARNLLLEHLKSQIAGEKTDRAQRGLRSFPQVRGEVIHELVQAYLQAGRRDERLIKSKFEKVIEANLDRFAELGLDRESKRIKLDTMAQEIRAFLEPYMAESPDIAVLPSVPQSGTTIDNPVSDILITRFLEIEEQISSPHYGLTGRIDATVLAVIRGSSTSTLPIGDLCPIEIKSGNSDHKIKDRAQTMLYCLLLQERYQVEVPLGLLYYTDTPKIERVKAFWKDLSPLIATRNKMVQYLMWTPQVNDLGDMSSWNRSNPRLPLIDCRSCNNGDVVNACTIYQQAYNVVDEPLSAISPHKMPALTTAQATFVRKWEALITLEEQPQTRRQTWTSNVLARELEGRRPGSVILDTTYQHNISSSSLGEPTRCYKFLRVSDSDQPPIGGFAPGDRVVLSVEPRFWAIARGEILRSSPNEVLIQSNDLDLDFLTVRLGPLSPEVIFHIDHDRIFHSKSFMRDNVVRLFNKDNQRQLELFVDFKPPIFKIMADLQACDDTSSNENQQHALKKVSSAEDYTLIQGMAGTGKTKVVIAIIRMLEKMGKTILLTAPKDRAVDRVLLGLKDANVDFLRLGNNIQKSPGYPEFMQRSGLPPPPVTVITRYSLDCLHERRFDYCIMVDASQVTIPISLGLVRFSQRIIMVGDYLQTRPLVGNQIARDHGLGVSLFEHLANKHPSAMVELVDQYRMNEDIMSLSNVAVYSNGMRCLSQSVRQQCLVLPDPTYLDRLHLDQSGEDSCHGTDCWIKRGVLPTTSVVLLEPTRRPAARDSPREVEADLVYQIAETLVRCGIHEQQIGIISVTFQQKELLSQRLHSRKNIDIRTADEAQGWERDCIILSVTRSSSTLQDKQRLNVAFSRARSKLVIVGAWAVSQLHPAASDVANLNGWVVRLPLNAHKTHHLLRYSSTPGAKRTASDSENDVLSGPPPKKLKTDTSLVVMPLSREIVNNGI